MFTCCRTAVIGQSAQKQLSVLYLKNKTKHKAVKTLKECKNLLLHVSFLPQMNQIFFIQLWSKDQGMEGEKKLQVTGVNNFHLSSFCSNLVLKCLSITLKRLHRQPRMPN